MKKIILIFLFLASAVQAQTDFKSAQISDDVSVQNIPSGTTLTFKTPRGILPNSTYDDILPFSSDQNFYCRLLYSSSSKYRILNGSIEIEGVYDATYNKDITYKIKDKDLKLKCGGDFQNKVTIGMVRAKLAELGIDLVLAEAVPF